MLEELVKRDFKQKYKRTVLGMFWSVLNPLFTLLVMRLVFSNFFGRDAQYYTTYIFAGNLMFSYFKEQTNGGMQSLMANAHIFTKINVPKYMFLLSKSVSAVINFGLTLVIFFVFVVIDGVPFHWSVFAILYPIVMLTAFNLGVGMILSALFVFFRDIGYIYVSNFLLCGRFPSTDTESVFAESGIRCNKVCQGSCYRWKLAFYGLSCSSSFVCNGYSRFRCIHL